jgi:predicted phosphodiesterase
MPASLALISDLHANLLALDAVLEDIERRGIEQTVCLGDVATLGPKPKQVLARLRELGCPCIQGNHDAFLLEPELIHSYTEAPVVVEAVDWCRDQLDPAELEFVRTFRSTLALELTPPTCGSAASKTQTCSVLLYHGSPHSHMKEILATTPANELDAELAGKSAEVYAGGHTHLQMLRQHRGKWIVNPGSVGMPFESSATGAAPVILPFAEYASVTLDDHGPIVHFHRIPMLKAALRAQANEAPDNPITPSLASNYR